MTLQNLSKTKTSETNDSLPLHLPHPPKTPPPPPPPHHPPHLHRHHHHKLGPRPRPRPRGRKRTQPPPNPQHKELDQIRALQIPPHFPPHEIPPLPPNPHPPRRVRQYPSIFEEFLPGSIALHPHLRLTPQLLEIDAKEQLMYQSQTYTHQAADRLFKLLMLARGNKLPLSLVELFRWDLGLPHDYLETIVPEFRDYFKVVVGKYEQPKLEMVCWSDELATSIMEMKLKQKQQGGYVKGMPVAFPMKFSRGFEMDKKMKKWIDEWQKLPYVSPYENAAHLSSQSDESDKWAVAVLHELLHILVPKKTEKENILALGEYLGIRSRFKQALLNHPGILYVSSKLRTYTVVLREGYKRGAIIENHPLMDIRNQYIHLMNAAKGDDKKMSSKEKKRKKGIKESEGEDVEDDDDDENEEEVEGEMSDWSEDEVEHDDVESEENEEGEEENRTSIQMKDANTRGSGARRADYHVMSPSRNGGRGSSGQRRPWKSDNAERGRGSSNSQYPGRNRDNNVHQNSGERSNRSRSRGRSSLDTKAYV